MRSCAVCCKDGFCSFTISTWSVEPCMRNLGLISSLVNISSLPGHVPAVYFPLFYRVANEDLDEHRLQRVFFAQDAPETLQVFALARPSPQHDRRLRFWHIDALVEYLGCGSHAVVPRLERVTKMR